MAEFTNTLFTNDNLFILNGLDSRSVDLIYLDPPFNTKRFYSAPVGSKAAGASFKDMWTWQDVNEHYLETMAAKFPSLPKIITMAGAVHSKGMMAYLTYMAQRIIEMHRVLKDTGSLYLHCDPTAGHYLKILLDEIFGRKNFRNEVVWCYRRWTNVSQNFQRMHDTIFRYSKSENYALNKLSEITKSGEKRIEKGYYTGHPTMKDGRRITNLVVYDADKAQKLIKEGKYDNIIYKTAQRGVVLPDWWEIPIINSQSKERTGYATQKPLPLLKRIILASSNEGDIVMDPFCGCATTCVAAQQLGRKWIGIDLAEQAVVQLVERLSNDAGMFSDFINTTIVPQRSDIQMVAPSEKSVKERLYREQNGKCNGCGKDFEMHNLEVDHIIPKAKGGGDYYENYQLLCGSCNRIKGARPMEYLRMKIKVREEMMGTKIIFGE